MGCRKKQRGFSLLELTIVLGIFAVIIAGLWTLVGHARQNARIAQATDAITSIADNVRSVYGGQASISANYPTLVPQLVTEGVFPETLVQKTASSCPGGPARGNYVANPWNAFNACGSIHVCAWNWNAATGNVGCGLLGASGTAGVAGSSGAVQFFAVALANLDYPTCVTLASSVYPSSSSGLVDVYVNDTSTVFTPGMTLPVPASFAINQCIHGATNNLHFIYRLRPPVS